MSKPALPSLAPVPAEATVEDLRAAVADRDAVIAALIARVDDLEARLNQNPRNSSRPPSSEGYSKPRSPSRAEQKAAGRKPGKQSGAPGQHLSQVRDPDQVVEHAPTQCGGCGARLDEANVLGASRRQVFDLPPPRPQVTEHRMQSRRCSCGTVTTAAAPAAATAPACYGPRVRALAVYFLHVQHLPVARTATLLAEVYQMPVSEGFLAGVLTDAGQRAQQTTGDLRALLDQARVAHFDETGVRVDGQLKWLHTACTARVTLLGVSAWRGTKAINELGVLPDFTGTVVHDGYNSYRGYTTPTHALCSAHILRELLAVTDRDPAQVWASDLSALLRAANKRAHHARDTGKQRLPKQYLTQLRSQYRALIRAGMRANPRPARTGRKGAPRLGTIPALLKRLDERQDEVLRFATDLSVPFTNNQAERDLRMAKLQMKISGCWRTTQGAQTFAALRSYTATARKNDIPLLEALARLLTGDPWIPAAAAPT